MTNFFRELKRRNVFRVGTAYAVAAWLIIQITSEIALPLGLPAYFSRLVIVCLGIGFPIALIFAWAFELTPEGLKTTANADDANLAASTASQKLNYFIIGALAIALGYFIWESRIEEPTQDSELPIAEEISSKSVAVLPFADLSEGGDQEWFSDGLTEEILNSLARLPELKVTARTSAFQFKGQDRNISEIAKVLGVAHVVEGSVRRIDNELRVTAQLIRASDGFHLWSETYDATADELFAVQRNVAEKIATTLDVFLDDTRREQMFASGTRNVEAFEAYLLGKDLYDKVHARTTNKTLWDANVFLARAMELDPGFGAPAIKHHDAFAHTVMDGPDYVYIKVEGEPPYTQEQAMALLLADLNQAAVNARNPESRLSGELTREIFSPPWHRIPGIVARLREVLDPSAEAHWDSPWLSNILIIVGEKGLFREISRAGLENDPLDPVAWSYMADVEVASGNFDEARKLINEGRAVAGDHPWMRSNEIYSAVFSGNREEAIIRLEAGGTDQPWYLPYLAAVRGNYAEATRLVDEWERSHSWPNANMLYIYHETGDTERARALTQQIDALPAGAVLFARLVTFSGGRSVIDLEYAPNFSARLREAGIDPDSFPAWPRLSVN